MNRYLIFLVSYLTSLVAVAMLLNWKYITTKMYAGIGKFPWIITNLLVLGIVASVISLIIQERKRIKRGRSFKYNSFTIKL